MVYMIEAICLGIFMVVATLTTTALQLPASPLHQAIEAPLLRRLLIGIVIGITAITINTVRLRKKCEIFQRENEASRLLIEVF
jgi:hypothetical protein